jgi:twitching motility protein PilI
MQATDVFQILKDIEHRSRIHAAPLPLQEKSSQFWTGVGFVLNGERYVAPLKEVAEILTLPTFTTVPGSKSWVRGVSNVRGTLLPLMDLFGFIGHRPHYPKNSMKVLVVNDENIQSGVVVDEVLGLQHFDEEKRINSIRLNEKKLLPYIKGGFQKDGQQWMVFSLFALAQDPEFLQVAI